MFDPTLHTDTTADAPPAVVEEFQWLMSLALDGLLEDEDRRRFDAHLAGYPTLAARWEEWQLLDSQLDALPHVQPAPGFVDRFEARLAAQEQHQQQRVLALSLVAAVIAGMLALTSVVGFAAFLLSTQGPWIGEQIHNTVYLSALMNHWMRSLTDAMFGLAGSPQVQMLGMVYVVVAAGMIVGWVELLRRNARLASAAPGME